MTERAQIRIDAVVDGKELNVNASMNGAMTAVLAGLANAVNRVVDSVPGFGMEDFVNLCEVVRKNRTDSKGATILAPRERL